MTTLRKILICAVVLAYCVFATWRIISLRRTNARHESNYGALCQDLERLTDDYSHEVARCQALELSKNEFEKLYAEQADLVRALNLKISRLQAMVNTTTVIRDTVLIPVQAPIVRDSGVVVRPFTYDDTWLSLRGAIRETPEDTVLGIDYTVRDTVDVYVYRVPKKFLFIRWGTKRYDCYVRNRNPHASVTNMSCTVSTKK